MSKFNVGDKVTFNTPGKFFEGKTATVTKTTGTHPDYPLSIRLDDTGGALDYLRDDDLRLVEPEQSDLEDSLGVVVSGFTDLLAEHLEDFKMQAEAVRDDVVVYVQTEVPDLIDTAANALKNLVNRL